MDANKTKNISVTRRIMNAIMKLQGNKGVTLVDLKKYLRGEKKLDVDVHKEEIKVVLKKAMESGILVRDNGLYMVKPNKPRQAKLSQEKNKSRDKTSMQKAPAKKKGKTASPKK